MGKKQKIIEIPRSISDQIRTDLEGNSVKIVTYDDLPREFINLGLIHQKVVDNSSQFYIGISGSTAVVDYIFVAANRVDHEYGMAVTDLDPVSLAFDANTGRKTSYGVVNYHSNFEGRVEQLGIEYRKVDIKSLRDQAKTAIIEFDRAPIRLQNAMHFAARKYNKFIFNK